MHTLTVLLHTPDYRLLISYLRFSVCSVCKFLKFYIRITHARIFSNKFGKSLAYSYLCSAMIEYIRLLRPLQWLKNVFVFAPIFFSNNLLKPEYFWPTLVVFASFCLVSSSIYCFNDLRDVEADRQHPKKCHRPIASGKVSINGGYAMMAISMVGALALIPIAQSPNTPYLYIIVLGYWLMNVAYCIRLKQYAILDVSIIAIGFVMRVMAGGLTTDIWIFHWLVMMTFLVTLFLAFTKRNDDYRIYEQTGTKPRVSITGYNKTFINEAQPSSPQSPWFATSCTPCRQRSSNEWAPVMSTSPAVGYWQAFYGISRT